MFTLFESYEPFFNMDYCNTFFRKLSFRERRDQLFSESVAFAMGNEPFAQIRIPANQHAYTGVSLGIMISFFISAGIIPNVTNAIHVE